MADSPEEIKKHVKLYMLIGAVLFVCTVLTVAVAKIEWLDFGDRGFDVYDMIIGLAIATFKATLVSLIFMHLNHEKKMIYWLFGFGLIFGFALMAITGFAFSDPIYYQDFFGR
ncbi:MAG: cytochrome C oxidase subunit IV family protein [Akkermansiaceae bacterium]